MLQYRLVKLIFSIISAIILLPIIKDGNSFYITLFIFLIDRVLDDFYYRDTTVCAVYIFWHLINRWIGAIACAFSFCMLYPGFDDLVSNSIGVHFFNSLLLIVLYSDVVREAVEVVHMDIRSSEIRANLEKQRRDVSK